MDVLDSEYVLYKTQYTLGDDTAAADFRHKPEEDWDLGFATGMQTALTY